MTASLRYHRHPNCTLGRSQNEKSLFVSRPSKSYCLYVWGAQIQIFRVFGHILTISTIGFLFWGFIRGNRPKMSLKYAISKIYPKLAESDIHVKQVSIPPFLGIVGNKKWCPFSNLGVRSPIFLHPKSLKLAVFGCWKIGLRTPKFENGHHFLTPTIPKNGGMDTYFTWVSFSGEFLC